MPPLINSHAIWELFPIYLQNRFFPLQLFAVHRCSVVWSYRSESHRHCWCSCNLCPVPGLATLLYLQRACRKMQTLSALLGSALTRGGRTAAGPCSKSHKLVVFNLRTFHSPSRAALNGEFPQWYPSLSSRTQVFHNHLLFISILYLTK